MNSAQTETQYNYFSGNYKIGYDYSEFGLISELIYSKVNPKVNPLKLKDSTSDKSIYPMVDEYGYQYSSKFIFSSNWDKNFYTITNADQITRVKRQLSSVTNVTEIELPPEN
jgi:hypothetical protein